MAMTTNIERDSVTARIDALLELSPAEGDSAETRLIKRAKLTPWHGDPDRIAEMFQALREARAHIESTRAPQTAELDGLIEPVAWADPSNMRDPISVGKKLDMERYNGVPGKRLAAKYTKPLYEHALNLQDKSVQRRLATQWGYAPQPSVSAAEGDGWRPISEAVEGKFYIVGWREEGEERKDFDWLEDGVWRLWEDHYQHFCAVGRDGNGGPSETPPYTHCIAVQPLPSSPKEPKP